MLHQDIMVRNSEIEGRGLVATKFIPKGTVIWWLDADAKWLTLDELLVLPEDERKYAYQHDDKFILISDGAQYMNHSCDPNTEGLGDDQQITVKDIQPGEEVTYDYATCEIDERFRPEWECRCGSANCRRVITYRDCLSPEFQKLHEGYLPSWTLEFIRQNQPT